MGTKLIRISEETLDILKDIKHNNRLNSYEEVILKLMKLNEAMKKELDEQGIDVVEINDFETKRG